MSKSEIARAVAAEQGWPVTELEASVRLTPAGLRALSEATLAQVLQRLECLPRPIVTYLEEETPA